jgi:DNA-3-methyladenine glycosylase I
VKVDPAGDDGGMPVRLISNPLHFVTPHPRKPPRRSRGLACRRGARNNACMSQRCTWADGDPLMAAYHDEEWGLPERDSRKLWAKLMLDGFQAGLSWITVLRKREAFIEAFEGFDPKKIAKYGEPQIKRLLANPGIIRSRAKIESTIAGAKAYLAMQAAGEDFSAFVWAFVDGKPIRNTTGIIPAKTALSEEMSKALKKRGFKFVGPVIVYAWMQAVGIVNDHSADCFRRKVR